MKDINSIKKMRQKTYREGQTLTLFILTKYRKAVILVSKYVEAVHIMKKGNN